MDSEHLKSKTVDCPTTEDMGIQASDRHENSIEISQPSVNITIGGHQTPLTNSVEVEYLNESESNVVTGIAQHSPTMKPFDYA